MKSCFCNNLTLFKNTALLMIMFSTILFFSSISEGVDIPDSPTIGPVEINKIGFWINQYPTSGRITDIGLITPEEVFKVYGGWATRYFALQPIFFPFPLFGGIYTHPEFVKTTECQSGYAYYDVWANIDIYVNNVYKKTLLVPEPWSSISNTYTDSLSNFVKNVDHLIDIKANAVESFVCFNPYNPSCVYPGLPTYCDGTTGPNVTKTTQVGATTAKIRITNPCQLNLYGSYITSNNGTNYDGSFTPSTGESITVHMPIMESGGNYPVNWELKIDSQLVASGSVSSATTVEYSWDGRGADPGYHLVSLAAQSTPAGWVGTDLPASCKATSGNTILVNTPRKIDTDCDENSLEVATNSTTNIAGGNVTHRQELFSTNGTLIPLRMDIIYNSGFQYNSSLGLNWTHNYDITLSRGLYGYMTLREGTTRRYYGYTPTETSTLTNNSDGTFTISYRNGILQNFNSEGRITSIVDQNGNTLNFAYNDGDLVSVSDPAGRSIAFQYENITSPHRIQYLCPPGVSINDSEAKKFKFEYDSFGRLMKVTNPLPETSDVVPGSWGYTYEDGRLKTKHDPNNNLYQYEYFPDGRMKKAIDPGNNAKSLFYNNETGTVQSTAYTEKDGGIWTYVFDTHKGRLFQKIAPNVDGSTNGKSTTYYYYDNGTMKAKTEPFDGTKMLTTFYTYDNYDNRLTETDPVDISIYSPAIDPATVDVTTLATMTPPIKPAIAYSYDYQNNDKLMSVTDYRSVPSAIMLYDQYEEYGLQVTKITDAFGKVSYVKKNSAGLIKEYIDANGKSTNYEYYPDTEVNRSTGLAWMLWKVNGPDGVVTIYNSYDKFGNATEIEVIDSTGLVRSTAVNEHDALGRLRKITTTTVGLSPIITTYGYDDNGNVTSIIDAEGNETKYEYTYDRQIKSITQYKSGTPVVTNYEYSATGCASCGGGGGEKLTQLVDAKQQGTSFQYDKLGRLEYEFDPLGNKLHYTYYDNNLMKEKYDATTIPEKLLTTYVYNNHGQITDKIHTDGTAEHSTYYPDGRLQTITNQNVTYTYEWYANGWLKSVTDDQGRKINYEYDNVGQRKKVTILAGTPDQRVITYDYDSANRPWTITSDAGTFTYAYDNLGRRDTVSYPNGKVADYDFDDLGRLTGITHKPTDGMPFAAYTYPLLDKVGNRKTAVRNGTEFTHLYDDLYRLWKTLWSTEKEEFIYDPVGNRTIGPSAKDTAYLHNAGNQITKGRKLGYTYDIAGNQTSRTLEGITDKNWTQTWDKENRLIKVEKTKGAEKKTVTFSYDPLGRRIGKQLTRIVEGETKTNSWSYVYDNESIAVEIFTDDTGNVTKTFHTHGPGVDEHLAMERNGSFYYFHQDGIRSVTVITDSNRNVVQSYEYDSFGMPKPSTSFRNSYQFAGRPWDKETGLYYNDARYYDPMEGRFVSRDPISFAGGDVNLYAYVQNNPINYTDPTGLLLSTDFNPGSLTNMGNRPMPGTPTGNVSPGNLPGIARFINGIGDNLTEYAQRQADLAAEIAIDAIERTMDCGTTINYMIIYGTFPLRFIALEPVGQASLTTQGIRRVPRILKGIRGCECR